MKTIQIDYTAKKDGEVVNSYKGDYPVETEDSASDGCSLYANIERICEGHDLILKIVDEFETVDGITHKTSTTFSCGACGQPFQTSFAEKKSYGKVYLYDENCAEPIAEYDLGAPLTFTR